MISRVGVYLLVISRVGVYLLYLLICCICLCCYITGVGFPRRRDVKTTTQVIGVLLAALSGVVACAYGAGSDPLAYQIELTAATSGFDGETCWVRAGRGHSGGSPGNLGATPLVVMTMQKLLLSGSNVFYALHNLWTGDLGATWTSRSSSLSSSGREWAKISR